MAQAAGSGFFIELGVPAGGAAAFEASQSDRDDAFVQTLGGQVEYRLRRVHAELASGVEDPADLHLARARFALDRFINRRKILLFPEDHSRGNRDFGVNHAFRGQPFE